MATRRVLGLMLVGAVLLLGGCGKASEKARESFVPPPDGAAPASTPAPAADRAGGSEARAAEANAAATSLPVALKARKIIYTGTVSLEVKVLEPALDDVKRAVAQAGGYVSALQQYGGAAARAANLTIRLPAERFEATMAALAKLGKVLSRELSTDDVTAQWVDLDARLRNLRREEERILAILARAQKIVDLLEIERELARVRGEIEQHETQFRHLNDQIALSTITVSLSLPAEVAATYESESWLGSLASRAAAMFVNVGKALVAVAVYLLALAPYALLLLAVRWAWRRLRGRWR